MRITVHAKPRSVKNEVEKISESEYRVFVSEPPIKGLANRAIVKLLSEYFNISQSTVTIISGHTSRNKIIEIL